MPNGIDWHRGNETACFDDAGNYTTELVVREAIGYLKRKADTPATPFFLYLPFHLIHAPNQVPTKYLDLYPKLNLSASAKSQGLCGVCECAGIGVGDHGKGFDQDYARRNTTVDSAVGRGGDATWSSCRTVLAMAAALDWAVGSIVDALKTNKQWENAIVIYTSGEVYQVYESSI
jgi:arylsulfatase A-like enzyme